MRWKGDAIDAYFDHVEDILVHDGKKWKEAESAVVDGAEVATPRTARSVDDIRTIVAELRKQRVVYFRDGEFEVRLADVPESGEVSYE